VANLVFGIVVGLLAILAILTEIRYGPVEEQ
jgi:hypothetical protein